MSATRSKHQLPPRMDPPWTNPEPLPDKPDGETNLLHRSAWENPANPLRVEFKPWYEFPPESGTETIDIFLDDDEGNVIASRSWNVPMNDDEYFVEIPADMLPEGEHRISYIMTNIGDVKDRSFPFTITVDKQPPLLNASSKLTFNPPLSPPNTLTALYLQQNGDQLKARVPAYVRPRPWDRITWFWTVTDNGTEVGGVKELDNFDFADPIDIQIPGSFIRGKGDGNWHVGYEVSDRAGNISLRSASVELKVDVVAAPRNLPPPRIKQVLGGGPASGTLIPNNGVDGVTTIILPEAEIRDGDRVFMQWAQEGSPGSYRTETPITSGGREYHIPKEKVAYHISRDLVVKYDVFVPGVDKPQESELYKLKVDRLTGTPAAQCDRVDGGGTLKLANIPAGGYANFTLERWPHMGTEQFLTIKVVGIDASNDQRLEIPVLTDSPVPEVAQKIDVGRISKADLQRFKLNLAIEVQVKVSFDGKLTWQGFATLMPLLVA